MATEFSNNINVEEIMLLKQQAEQFKILQEEMNQLKQQAAEFQQFKQQANQIKELKQQVEEFKEFKQQATESKEFKQHTAEFNVLKTQLNECKSKLNNITKARINKRSNDEILLLEKFFDDYIIIKKGSLVKTVDVMTKANEVLADSNLRFNKFEMSQFMKDKKITKKKGPNHTYYVDIQILDQI